ncbi:SAM-dependent methyltransferase [Streptomyces sp. NBRC 109706]|uniref:SAM-dependent methyltransferase n=1 Tax=Streptomyces sp. NBRC 109706 TaxID=1550035 RepID=UPI0007837E17|nr:SAM-dependent methyltransferase [Streptomyces sp. NBRC 109706]
MSTEGFAADQIDTSRPHPARMYDYYLGGQDNYEVDRLAAERALAMAPEIRAGARENRFFLHRATRAVAERGIRQIIDIGTGIPTEPNTHQVARGVDPDIRVAYVDNDPIVATYAGAKLTNEGNAGFVLGDLREPRAVMEHPTVEKLIDFDQPVALLLVSVLHFVEDAEDPAAIVGELTSRLVPGSCLVLSHATHDFHRLAPGEDPREVYQQATASLNLRTGEQIRAFFDGFDLLEPGLVQPPHWRPTAPVPDTEEMRTLAVHCGVGVKP